MNENENTPITPENNENNENNTNSIPESEPETPPSQPEESEEATQAFNWDYTDDPEGSEPQAETASEPDSEQADTPIEHESEISSDQINEEPSQQNEEENEHRKKKPSVYAKNRVPLTAAILSFLSIALLLAFCASAMLGLIPTQSTAGDNPTLNNVTINTTVNSTPTSPDTEIDANVLEEFLYSVVIVKGTDITGTSTGTGVIFSSNGYIITNYHVIEGCDTISVELYGEATARKATVVGFHAEDDVAVIKIDRNDLRPATFADSDAVRYGEKVYAIGTPEGTDFGWSVTQGIVSSPRRELMIYDSEGILEKKISVVQTDASVNHGNSGGPIINVRGEVVGIVTLRHSKGTGMGFALPADKALAEAVKIIDKNK